MITSSSQKKISLFLLFLTIITVLEGVCMWLASYFHKTVSIFGFIHMMIPITVTFLVFLTLSDKHASFPKYVCKAIFASDILMILWAVLEILIPSLSQLEILLVIICTVIFYLSLFFEPADIREQYGFSLKNSSKIIKHIFFYLLLFFILYSVFVFIRILFDYFGGNHSAITSFLKAYYKLPKELSILIPFSLLILLPYLGEEYGWRGALQPWMQKQFGMKRGIILTGLIWGIWHFPYFLYQLQFSCEFSSFFFIMTSQIFFCISIGIFLGYVYLKTKNIWICVAIHFINNNFLSLSYSSSSDSFSILILQTAAVIFASLFLYAPFLHSKIFRNKKIIDSFVLPQEIMKSSHNDLEHKNSE